MYMYLTILILPEAFPKLYNTSNRPGDCQNRFIYTPHFSFLAFFRCSENTWITHIQCTGLICIDMWTHRQESVYVHLYTWGERDGEMGVSRENVPLNSVPVSSVHLSKLWPWPDHRWLGSSPGQTSPADLRQSDWGHTHQPYCSTWTQNPDSVIKIKDKVVMGKKKYEKEIEIPMNLSRKTHD